MANPIADAPVGATKAPARAKSAPAPTPRGEPEPTPQWLVLGLQHTRRLCDLLYRLIEDHMTGTSPGLVHELVGMAESHLYAVADEDSHIDTSPDGQLYGEINMVVTMLKAAQHVAEHGPLVYPSNLYAAVIPAAIVYAEELQTALQAAPENIAPLLALNGPQVIAGARPNRDQPRPPIRRVGSDDVATMLLTAESLGHVLYHQIVEPSSGIDDPNDPAGWQQQEIALIVALQTQIADIRAAYEGGAR